MRAWRSLPDYRGDAAFSSWLTAIGWRCYLDYLRGNRRRERTRDAFAGVGETSHAPMSGAAIDLERALVGLAANERAALVLCEGHGWSHSEAAAILALPLGTLKSLVARAKAKCRARLEQAGLEVEA